MLPLNTKKKNTTSTATATTSFVFLFRISMDIHNLWPSQHQHLTSLSLLFESFVLSCVFGVFSGLLFRFFFFCSNCSKIYACRLAAIMTLLCVFVWCLFRCSLFGQSARSIIERKRYVDRLREITHNEPHKAHTTQHPLDRWHILDWFHVSSLQTTTNRPDNRIDQYLFVCVCLLSIW